MKNPATESAKPIGIFDSGIGGLTVLHEAMKALPSEKFLYYADTAHVPYGTKSKEEVREYILEAARFFSKQSVKALVLACNTATSSAVNEVRELYHFPVIGMEPAVKPAVEKSNGKRVLVLATQLTLKEQKFKELVARVDNDNIVDMIAMPELVEMAEKFEFREEIIIPLLKRNFSQLQLNNYGTIVLGCTHYVFFKKTIQHVFSPDKDVIDGNEGTVKHLKNVLQKKHLLNEVEGDYPLHFFNSGVEATDTSRFIKYLDLLRTG